MLRLEKTLPFYTLRILDTLHINLDERTQETDHRWTDNHEDHHKGDPEQDEQLHPRCRHESCRYERLPGDDKEDVDEIDVQTILSGTREYRQLSSRDDEREADRHEERHRIDDQKGEWPAPHRLRDGRIIGETEFEQVADMVERIVLLDAHGDQEPQCERSENDRPADAVSVPVLGPFR